MCTIYKKLMLHLEDGRREERTDVKHRINKLEMRK
jgi:hypothetical protein